MEINAYLNFMGNTEEAFNFYRSVFGGEFTFLQRLGETPDGDKLPAEDQKKLMHVALPIGKNMTLMGTDALESMGHHLTFGNNFHLSVSPDSEEQAQQVFAGLSAGGKVDMPLQKMFWGALFGSLTDKFDVKWMVNYTLPQQ
jgi:PhnB protein